MASKDTKNLLMLGGAAVAAYLLLKGKVQQPPADVQTNPAKPPANPYGGFSVTLS